MGISCGPHVCYSERNSFPIDLVLLKVCPRLTGKAFSSEGLLSPSNCFELIWVLLKCYHKWHGAQLCHEWLECLSLSCLRLSFVGFSIQVAHVIAAAMEEASS